MKTLYLHIGTPKTATTSIQEFCYANRKVLASKGCCFPMFTDIYRYPQKGPKRNGLFLEARILGEDKKPLVEEEKRVYQACMNRVHACFEKYDSVILSDESIWEVMNRRKKNLWGQLKKEADQGGFTIKIIVYLRRQDSYVDSWWNQRIKKGTLHYCTTPWDQFVTEDVNFINPDYLQSLEKIAAVFGRENIIVRRFDRKYFLNGSVEEDFMNILGLKVTEEFRQVDAEHNQRLAGNPCEIKRVINGLSGLSWKENVFFWNRLLEISPISAAEYPTDNFTEEQAREFMSQFEENNRKIAEWYLKDGEPLFNQNFSNKEKWQADNPHMYADIIRFVAADSVVMLRTLEDQKKVIQEQENKLEELQNEITGMRSELQKLEEGLQLEVKDRERMKNQLKHPLRTLLHIIKSRLVKTKA
ncbi:MAG: hypothetical protein PUB22_09670 [Clostridiales bacterium]|nr:hypothetical protein [Clostridiales bacterium]